MAEHELGHRAVVFSTLSCTPSISLPMSLFSPGQEYIPSGVRCQDIRGAGQGGGTCQHPLWLPRDIQCHGLDV